MREVCRSRLVDGKYVNKLEKITKGANDKALKLAQIRNTLNKFKKDPLLSTSWNKSHYFEDRLKETNQQVGAARREMDKIRLMPYSDKNRDYIVHLNTRLDSQIRNANLHVEQISNYRNSIRQLVVTFEKNDKSLDALSK